MRKRIILGLFTLAFAFAALAVDPTAVYYSAGTASTVQSTVTFTKTSEGVVIANDSTSISLWFVIGTGTVNTSTGAGGGEIKPGETFTHSGLRCNAIGLKTASSTAAYRVWAGQAY